MGLGLEDSVGVCVALAVPDCVREDVTLRVCDWLGEGVAVAVMLGVRVPDWLFDCVSVGL